MGQVQSFETDSPIVEVKVIKGLTFDLQSLFGEGWYEYQYTARALIRLNTS